MERYNCTCHCGGSMFYKHLHDPSCDLFMHGEEAPQSKEAQLQAALDAEREKVKRLSTCGTDHSTPWWQVKCEDLEAQLATLQARCAHLDVLLRDEYLPKLDVVAVRRSIADRDSRIDALEREVEKLDDDKETLQAQLRQVEGDRQTLRQLVAALPVVDVQEVSVWLSPDESGWLVSKRPAFPAGLYWAKFRTQAEADSFRALLAYRATLAAKDAGKEDVSHD